MHSLILSHIDTFCAELTAHDVVLDVVGISGLGAQKRFSFVTGTNPFSYETNVASISKPFWNLDAWRLGMPLLLSPRSLGLGISLSKNSSTRLELVRRGPSMACWISCCFVAFRRPVLSMLSSEPRVKPAEIIFFAAWSSGLSFESPKNSSTSDELSRRDGLPFGISRNAMYFSQSSTVLP